MITLNNDLEPSVEEPYVEGQPLELDQLPQEQPLEEEFVRPAIEAEEKYQNDMKAWRAKTSEDTDRYLLEFDAYQPEDDLPVRKQKLIRRVLDVEHDLSPETSTSYEMARAQASNKMFGETLDDEQFFTKLQERAQTTKDARDLDTSMAQSAFLSLTSPEDSNFHDWGAENVDGIISGEENAKNLARWNEHQDRIEEAYGDLLPLIRGTYSAMSNDADWVEYAKSQVSGLDDEEKDKYLYGLRAALGNNPKPEIVNKFKRLGINILKSSRGVKSAVRNARTFVGNEIREDDTTYGFAKLFGSEEDANKVSQNAREDKLLAKQLRENGNFINELRSVFENEYDPVQLLAKEGSRLAAIESGAYQIPGALTTTAIAALPVVGTAITYGSLAESSRQSYMAAILSEGRATGSPISRSEADDIASRMGLVAAVPSMFLERFQATAFTKNKGISKAVSKFDGLIKNSIARRITKFGVASSAETAVELTQEVSDSLVQAAATAFSEEVPDVVWSNGEDGVFDDYFNKFLTTFTAVAPLGVISAHRGVDVELKAQAFKDVSELERRAFGITKHDSESIDNATNPTELVEAYQQAIENKDGNSEEAINATQELAASIEDKAKVEREMVDKGRLLGARTSPDSELLEVYNSKTGEVVAEGLDRASAAGFIMNHFNLKEREKTQLHDEIVSQIEGAQLLQEGSDSVTEFLPFKELTQATAAEEFVGSEERITEEGVDLERLDGGTGDITRSVLGAQLSAGQYGRAANTNVLFGNSTLFTAIHEHAHEVRKRWLRDGSFTFIEQVDALQGIDKAFRELTISRKENGETVTVKGSDRTFLPDDFNDRTPEAQERLVDEAIAQLAEQFSLRSRNGKKTKFRELLNKNLSARVSRGDKGAIKLKAFVRAMRDWFSLNLERSQLMRKAEREGKLDSAQLDELQAKIFGETTQGNHDAKAQEAYDGIVDENVPFSVGGRRASGFAQAQAEGRTFEGKDGLARFELDSSKAKIKSFRFASDEELISQEREEKELQKKFSKKEITGLELEEGWSSLGVKYDGLDKNSAHGITSILDFKELFESYPSLSNYSVIFKDIPLDVIGGGRFKTSAMIDLQGGIISIDNDVLNDVDKLKSTLLHELQHAIQSLEVFELGDNPLNDGYDSYKKSNGEREARGVESRINMTAEERLASPFMNDFASFSVGSVTPAQDAKYLSLAQDPDANKEELDAMVERAARDAGYDSPKVYHGTSKDFNEFSKETIGRVFKFDDEGFFFTNSIEQAKKYASQSKKQTGGSERLISSFLKLDNPFTYKDHAYAFMDHEDPIIGMDDELLISWADRYREDHIEDAKDYGMDGLFYERGNEVLAAVFNPNQIKSAEAITRDESGAIIPLSQRFNEESDDIRFSVGSITPEQDKTSPPEGDEAIAIFNSEVEFPSFPHISLFQSASGEPDDTSLSSDVKTDVSFSVGKAREKHNLILEDLKSLNEAVNKAEQYLSTHGGVIPVTTGSRGGIAFTRYSERNEKLTSVYDENKESYARPIAGDIFEYNGKEATVSDDGVRVVWGDKPWENDPVGWIDNSLIMQKTIVDLRAELANKEADLYLIEEDFDPDKESRLKDKKTVYKRDLSEKASMFAALLDARDVESKNASKSFISKVWGAYAKHDELFQYGKSKSKSAEEIAESISSPGRSISADESSDSVRFISANGSLTIQDADTDRPYIAASGASSSGKKQGGGSQLYMAALDWIHNNGKRIKDDPAGITGINSIRRTSNFFASSIRWGTTKHLKAHAQQEVGRWTRHDTLNTSLLALKEMENTFKAIPEAQDWTFDFKTAKFKNNGRKITDKTFEKTIKKADPSKSGIGLSTLQRAIITSSSIQEFKRGATESIMEAAEAPLRESLTGVSYSVGNSKIADSIITDVTKRIKNPEAKVRIMGSVIERVAAMKREVDVMGVAFGKLSVTKAIVDPRTIKSLKKEAAFRQADLTEEYTNKVHEESGFILEQEDLAKLKEQPLHAYLSKPNDPLHGQLTSKSQAIKQDKLGKKDGDYDGAANVSRTLFGGTLMPDQAAAELYEQGLIAEDDVNLMWEALEQEQASVTNRKEEFKGGKAKLNDAKKRAREEAKAWLDEELAKQERDHNPRTAMLRSLAMYDAILMALPIELRGKMGGYVQLAKLKTDEARLEFMLKKMEKLEKVVDSWVKKEADKDLKKFFKRAAAKRQKSGKTDKGKFDGESHKIFSAIKEATKLTMEEVDAQVAAAESVVAQGSEVDSDTWIRNLMLTNLLPQFGDWKNQTAEGRTEALKAGWHVFERALLDAQIRDAAQRERYEAGREEFKAATGIKHKGEEFNKALQNQKNIDKAKGIKKTAKDLDLNLSGFGSLLERLFGKNELTEQWYEKQRRAEMIQSNLRRRAGDVVNDYFIEKAGSEIKGMNMVADLMKPSIETSSGKYSEMQGLTATMMWMQEDGRKHMEGSKDENGKVTSSWSYDQEFIDHIESNLSDEAKGFRSLLLQKYEEGYAPLNEVHKRVHYIDMPKVSNYSPLTVKSFMEAMDKGIDPFTHAGSGNAGSAGFTKRRSSIAVAEPSFEDAFTVFMAHTDQSAHFIAFAELSKDMNAIIGQRDVMNHVEVKAGEQGRVSLKSWLDFYNEGGARSAGSRLGINRWLHGVFGNMAKMALALKPSVTFIQGTILGGAVVDMPVKSYLKGMAKLASGKLDIRATWNTEFIQQRYLDKPVIMQALQSGDPSQAPNKMQYWVDKIAHYGISGADALFTSATYAIYEDHYTNEANSLELKGEIAAEYIKLKTIKSTEKVSQPTRTGTRSIMENTERSPFKIMGMAFASDSRMKASLLAQTLMSGTKAEKARALVFFYVVNGFGAAVIRNVWRDARNDDDDELFDAENWNLKAMLVATMFGPINGIPIIGDQVSNAANDFFGERNFYGTLADGIGKGAKPLTKLDDYLYGDVDGDRFLKDLEAVLTTAGALSDKAVPAKSIISLLRDLNKLKDNVIAE